MINYERFYKDVKHFINNPDYTQIALQIKELVEEIEKQLLCQNQGNFPLLIQLEDGRRWLCSAPHNLPNAIGFKILETNCPIEIMHGGSI